MKALKLFLVLISIGLLSGCHLFYFGYGYESAYFDMSRNNNACKILKDTVVLYAVFVDTKTTKPWTKFDIESTLDSMRLAMHWIEEEARLNGREVVIRVEYHQDRQGKIPIRSEMLKKTLSATVFYGDKAPQYLDKWADKVARKAQLSLERNKDKMVTTENKPRDRERLIAGLRDLYGTESVVLMFLVNNYYQTDVSVSLYNGAKYPINPIEYAVVSYKEPSTIAHEFLHVFGAIDIYRYANSYSNMVFMEEYLGDAIMAFPDKNLPELHISEISKYMIGWDKELSKCSQLIVKDIMYGSYYRGKKRNRKKEGFSASYTL